jgi:hypothetical protein
MKRKTKKKPLGKLLGLKAQVFHGEIKFEPSGLKRRETKKLGDGSTITRFW